MPSKCVLVTPIGGAARVAPSDGAAAPVSTRADPHEGQKRLPAGATQVQR